MATDAFLAIRGRNSDEFVDYFIGSICAVPQFMGAKGVSLEQGFIAISDALHESEDKRTEMKNHCDAGPVCSRLASALPDGRVQQQFTNPNEVTNESFRDRTDAYRS